MSRRHEARDKSYIPTSLRRIRNGRLVQQGLSSVEGRTLTDPERPPVNADALLLEIQQLAKDGKKARNITSDS